MNFYFEGGLKSFVRYLNRNRQVLHEPVYAVKESDNIEVELAIQYTASMVTSEFSFANTINTPDGGTHLTGLRTALTRPQHVRAKNSFLKDKDRTFPVTTHEKASRQSSVSNILIHNLRARPRPN